MRRPLPPLILERPSVKLTLQPEAVSVNDLAMVHAALTASLVQAFRVHDPGALTGWVDEVCTKLLTEVTEGLI